MDEIYLLFSRLLLPRNSGSFRTVRTPGTGLKGPEFDSQKYGTFFRGQITCHYGPSSLQYVFMTNGCGKIRLLGVWPFHLSHHSWSRKLDGPYTSLGLIPKGVLRLALLSFRQIVYLKELLDRVWLSFAASVLRSRHRDKDNFLPHPQTHPASFSTASIDIWGRLGHLGGLNQAKPCLPINNNPC